MTDSPSPGPAPAGHRSRLVGRIGRLLLGGFLVADAVLIMLSADRDFHRTMLAAVIGLVVFYAAVHWLVARYVPRLNRWIGAFVAVTPAAIAYVIGPAPVRIAVTSFIGVSLLLDGLLANAGCEVMAIPGLVLRHRTHLVCVAFSPIDWLESHLAHAKHRRKPDA